MNKKKEPDYSCWKAWNETLTWSAFLEYIKPIRHIRVGTPSNNAPSRLIFFRITKKELIDTVRSNRTEVTFDVMVNPRNKADTGTMFIHKIRTTLLDKNFDINEK